MDAIDRRRLAIEDHPLHQWLVADDGVAPEEKLWFGMYFTNFIMYFRELNLYHVGYREPGATDPCRSALTAHADEDMTHSRLFMRDFRTLGWDELLGWRPSEVYQWLFTSGVNEELRRRTVTIAKLYIEAEDPAVRYAVVEAIEACGNALFRHTAQTAARARSAIGRDLVYWGEFHLDRETGHAVDVADEAQFADIELDDARRADAIRRVDLAFSLIEEQNAHMLALAQETIARRGFAHRREPLATPDVLPDAPAAARACEGPWPEPYPFHFWPTQPHASQLPLVRALGEHADAVRHPEMLAYLRVDDPQEAVRRLRLMLLFFATDCAGTPTFYRYMVPCPTSDGAEQRAVNRIASQFGSRTALMYVDWASLQLDETLDWPVSRTLDFIYLDPATETHRDMRAAITHHIDVTHDPFLRYWALVSLKVMSGVYAEACAALARQVEGALGIDLPYLALRRVAVPPLVPDADADAVRFEAEPRDPALVARAEAAIARIGRAAQARNVAMLGAIAKGAYPELRANPLNPTPRPPSPRVYGPTDRFGWVA